MSRKKHKAKKKGRWKNFGWELGESGQILKAWTLLFDDRNFEEALVYLEDNNFIDAKGQYYYDRLTEEQRLAWEIFFGQTLLPPCTLTKHHMKPRSRGGTDVETNILYKAEFVHQSWHNLFINKLPDEIIRCLTSYREANWQRVRSHSKKMRSWLVVFGNKFFLKEIVAIIKKDWFNNLEEF